MWYTYPKRRCIFVTTARSMIFSIVALILSRAIGCRAKCDTISLVNSTSGRFNLATYNGLLLDDICRWTLEPALDDFVILIDFKDIDLSRDQDGYTSTCAAVVSINGERFRCHRRDPFCLTYTTSSKCDATLTNYPHCLRRSQTSEKLEMEFDAYYYQENVRKFEAEYKVLSCNDVSTTTALNLNPKQGIIGEIKDRQEQRNADEIPTTTADNRTTTKVSTNVELIVILLPIVMVILVVVVLTIWCMCRRSRRKSQDENSDDSENSFGVTKNTTANVAYQSWNPQDDKPELPERTVGVSRNVSIPGVAIPYSDYSDFNIYEAIPSAPPSIITPGFSELGQRYFEIGFNRLNGDFANQGENMYQGGDRNTENQDPYDMAISTPEECAT